MTYPIAESCGRHYPHPCPAGFCPHRGDRFSKQQIDALNADPCPECGGRMLDAGTDEASGERYRRCSGECDRMERADPIAQDFANFGREE